VTNRNLETGFKPLSVSLESGEKNLKFNQKMKKQKGLFS